MKSKISKIINSCNLGQNLNLFYRKMIIFEEKKNIPIFFNKLILRKCNVANFFAHS